MDLYLTYRGHIPANKAAKESVWGMREAFHSQLLRLWGKEPFSVLKDWEDSKFASKTPQFIKRIGGHTFVPFYGKEVGIAACLEIKLLTAMPPQRAVISNGDLDNRLKRIIDALRAPTQTGELREGLPESSRWYFLLDNDDSVSEVTASLAPYLDSKDDKESFVFIRVRAAATNVSLDNLAMLL